MSVYLVSQELTNTVMSIATVVVLVIVMLALSSQWAKTKLKKHREIIDDIKQRKDALDKRKAVTDLLLKVVRNLPYASTESDLVDIFIELREFESENPDLDPEFKRYLDIAFKRVQDLYRERNYGELHIDRKPDTFKTK